MTMQYLAQTMTEQDHPGRTIGFILAKFVTLFLIVWGIYRGVRKKPKRHAPHSTPQQYAPPYGAPYPPHAAGPWGPPNPNGPWGSPQTPYAPPQPPYAPPGQHGQHLAWPTHPPQQPPLTNYYR